MSNTKQFGESGVWRGWVELGGDINWEEHGGKWCRKDPNLSRVFYVIEHMNLVECMGERDVEAGGLDKYVSSISRIDLDEIPESEVESALESCGIELANYDSDETDLVVVEALTGYGCAAPMGEYSDPSYPERSRAAARREVEELIADSVKCEDMLDRPVNAIGSTARDFGQGNIMAGLDRYKVEQETRALKVRLKRVPSDDPIAFAHGFQTGCAGGAFPADESDLAPEWLRGHELGLKVRNGDEDIRELNHWVEPDTSNTSMDLMVKLQSAARN